MTSSLFSHAPDPEPQRGAASVADIEESCVVPRETDEAFRGFHEYLHLWWPAEFSTYGEGMHPEFESGSLTETSLDEETALWATVREIRPDELLAMDWFLGHSPTVSTSVELRFEPQENHTRVTVQHSGFGRIPDGLEVRDRLAGQWRNVLQRYARFMGAR
ncbi:SRPBCC domain-containing protein [Arthrobacter sp. Sa2BUA2]|uniref:SRPBCC domain-containing protein n=1 Tax=Arthrobacter pullicola TaxID=2762224 RepID=A0ABR8YLX9_9MICC|nr:SRPBCC domain-containing protein [Arthrobacter pullicola]MBD8045228.1 SRPBCC domain-containing protein [Arthrobacter pullicola]